MRSKERHKRCGDYYGLRIVVSALAVACLGRAVTTYAQPLLSSPIGTIGPIGPIGPIGKTVPPFTARTGNQQKDDFIKPTRPTEAEPANDAAAPKPDGDPEVHWFKNVYRGDVPQFTIRSFVVGSVLGALMALSNLYVGLKTGWGNSMLNFVGLIGVALTSQRFSRASLDRIAVSAAVLLVAVPLGYALMVSVFHPRSSTKPLRASWPQKEMTARMNAIWTRETGQPLRVVGGDAWIAGLVGLSAPAHPSIFINGEYKISPWITPERLALAAAVIHGPKILFLDEPFEGVDAIAAGMLKTMLQGMIQRGATIFLTTHVLEIVERLCSHVAIISKGRLVANGSLEELRAGVASALPGEESGQRLTLEQIFLSIVGAGGQEPAQELSWLT